MATVGASDRATSTFTKAALVLGGIPAAFFLLTEALLGAALAYGYLVPWPPDWPGVAFATTLGLVGPAAVLFVCLRDRRRSVPPATRLWRMEVVGIASGLPVSVFLLFVIAALSVI